MLNRENTLTCAAAGAVTLASSVAAFGQRTATAGAAVRASTDSSGDIAIDRLAIHYGTLVGSTEQARLLIEGMGGGMEVAYGETRLAGSGKPMGYVNINIALALASAFAAANLKAGEALSAQGFFSALADVMGRRAGGLGWGQIAKDLGFSLDQVLSASNTAQVATRASYSNRFAATAQVRGSTNLIGYGNANLQAPCGVGAIAGGVGGLGAGLG
jgi:hypothetical protein